MTSTPPASLPTVAVLLSTYSGEAFLEAQLDSLAAQESVAVEVFVRDDGSTDGTLAVLAKYAHVWPALAAPLAGANLGPALSFLELMRSAPGDFDYYAFCDQDDVWLPDKLSRAVQRLGDRPSGEPALYCSRVMCVDGELGQLGPSPILGDPRFEHLLFENIAFGNTVVMNTGAAEILRSRAPTGGIVMHDWWCALVISALGVVIYDERPSVLYRQHRANTIGGFSSRLAEILPQIEKFLRAPRGFYRIHGQATELLRLYGERLGPDQRRLTQALVASRRSFTARLGFALSDKIVRAGLPWAIAARLLVVADLY